MDVFTAKLLIYMTEAPKSPLSVARSAGWGVATLVVLSLLFAPVALPFETLVALLASGGVFCWRLADNLYQKDSTKRRLNNLNDK